MEECSLSQEELSRKVGKDRSTVANFIRLLKLPTEVQIAIRDGKISMGHARALITIAEVKTQLIILHRILEKKLSVRQVEELVRNLSASKSTPQRHENLILPVKFEKVRNNLHKLLNAKVEQTWHFLPI